MKEPTYLTIAGVTKGYWPADDPAIVEWKRKAEALAKIVKEWNGSPKPCQQEARRLIPEVLDAIESVREGV